LQSELQTLGRQPGQVPASRLLFRIGSGNLLPSGDERGQRGWHEVGGHADETGEVSGLVLNRGARRGESEEERGPGDRQGSL
jgi:hypothetical protein